MNNSLYLLYHELRQGGSAYQYVTSCSAFEAHCKLYARLQADAGRCLRPEITFDDGHVSAVRFALPILHAYGLRAQFFITAGWTAARTGFMSWAELRELQGAGHTIGAHGMTHKLLPQCTPTELQQELTGARKRLEDGIGVAVQTMSLPGGRADRKVFAACRKAGFTQVFTSVPRATGGEVQQEHVGRLNLTGTATVEFIEDVLTPSSGRLHRLYRMHQGKAAMKAVLGDTVYARVWAAVNRQEEPEPGAGETRVL